MELALTAKQYEGQDLGDVDFADRELRGVRFVNCRFYRAAMSGLFTRDCAFLNCIFSFAALNGSVHIATLFQNCTFNGASLFSAEMKDCKCSGSSFAGANLTGFTLHGGNFSDTVFDGCDLRMMDLQGICFSHAFFKAPTWKKRIYAAVTVRMPYLQMLFERNGSARRQIERCGCAEDAFPEHPNRFGAGGSVCGKFGMHTIRLTKSTQGGPRTPFVWLADRNSGAPSRNV